METTGGAFLLLSTKPESRPTKSLHPLFDDCSIASVTLGVVFLAIFVVLLGIGDGAPNVLIEVMPETDDYERGVDNTSYITKFSLERENQLFWVDMRLDTGALEEDDLPETMDLELSFEVRAKSKCLCD